MSTLTERINRQRLTIKIQERRDALKNPEATLPQSPQGKQSTGFPFIPPTQSVGGTPEIQEAQQPTPEIPQGVKDVGQFVKEAGIPTVLGETARVVATGAALTNPATAPFAVPIGVAADSAGSAAGEMINQFFGITPKSKTQVALSAAGPVVAKGLQDFASFVFKSFRGADKALIEEAIDKFAGKETRQLLESGPLTKDFAPIKGSIIGDVTAKNAVPAKQIFKQLSELPNVKVQLPGTKATLDSLESSINKGTFALRDKRVLDVIDSLKKSIVIPASLDPDTLLRRPAKAVLDFESIRENMVRLKRLLKTEDKNLFREYSTIIQSFADDLATAAPSAGGQSGKLLKQANKAISREIFQDNLIDLASKHIKPDSKTTELVINLPSIMNELQRGKAFKITQKALPTEISDIVKTLKILSNETSPRVRSSRGIGRAVGGSLIGGSLFTAGVVDQTVAGAIPVVSFFGPQIFGWLLSTRPGRIVIKTAARKGPLTLLSLKAAFQAVQRTKSGRKLAEDFELFTKEVTQDNPETLKFLDNQTLPQRPNPELAGL